MKMSKELYSDMREFILSKMNYELAFNNYQNGKFERADKVTNLQKRFCFDAYTLTGANRMFSARVSDEKLNDNHVLAALKRILGNPIKK